MSTQARLPFESRVEREFADWIATADGVLVATEIVARARRLLARGVRHYGVKAMFESIRYDWTIGLLGGAEYRLNNNHTSLMARHLMDRHPELRGFFETRELRGRL